ncbi:hypothetical protein Alg130_08469 [Pyrenophora tritici-repentis]|nr:hypothetical protein PtrV1_10021 [Pyrenophora tritici-repentis]KAI0577242.1 hypothetical protein Alg130_08469 [Pyrenophora tritici-repentis]KAI0609500.1 hypothetical protein TUN205_06274 [Pyrenophora tritici-repentis]
MNVSSCFLNVISVSHSFQNFITSCDLSPTLLALAVAVMAQDVPCNKTLVVLAPWTEDAAGNYAISQKTFDDLPNASDA